MPTPDFEEWLKRQEIPIEYETTIDKWQQYMIDRYGFKKGTLNVTELVYEDKFNILEKAGITPYETVSYTAYERIEETRYIIKGEAGFFGKIKAYDIAEERLTAQGETRLAEIAHTILIEALSQPSVRRVRYE